MLELSSLNFDPEVTKTTGITVVDFWAEWCQPCKIMGPLIEELSREMKEGITFAKVDVDASPDLAMRFNVLSIPTFVVMKGGSEVGRFSGAMSKDDFRSRVDAFLK